MTPTDQWKVRLSSFTSSLSDYFLSVGTSEQHFQLIPGHRSESKIGMLLSICIPSLFFHSLWQTLLKRHYLLHSSSLHRHSAVSCAYVLQFQGFVIIFIPFSGKSKTLARFSPCLGLCRWIILFPTMAPWSVYSAHPTNAAGG